MKKRRILILTSLFILILLFIGCQGNEQTEVTESEQTETVTTEEYDYWTDHGYEGGVSELDKLDTLGLEKDDIRLDYIRAFVTKDTEALEKLCGVKPGVYEDYAKLDIYDWYAFVPHDYELYFAFAISGDSAIKDFSPDSVNIWSVNTQQGSVYISRGIGEAPPMSQAAKELWEFLNHGFSALPTTDDVGSAWHITCYIVERFANGGALSLEQMQAYAKLLFGIDNFIPSDSHKSERGYEVFGHSGTRQSMRLMRETKLSDDKYMMDFQFYADRSMTVPSHSYRYIMEKLDGEWVFASCEMLSEAKHQPMIDFE